MIIVRHGLMIVGYSFGAKTSMYRTLGAALGMMKERGADENAANYYVLNPKSITMGQLYGQFDPVTHEWSDGILAVTYRYAAQQEKIHGIPDRQWVMLDGPVDAIWIENMNTVLDDNKKLCLMSGEMISMSGPMSMIFEVQDLAVASPATVSRCGMVYTEPSQIGWEPLLKSWLDTLPEALMPHKEKLHNLFGWLVPPRAPLRRQGVQVDAHGGHPRDRRDHARQRADEADDVAHLRLQGRRDAPRRRRQGARRGRREHLHVRAHLVGRRRHRRRVAPQVRRLPPRRSPRASRRAATTKVDGVFGEAAPWAKWVPEGEQSVFEYVYLRATHKWVLWTDTILKEDTKISPTAEFSQIIVPTLDTARYTFLLDTLLQHDFPALFVGPTGTGKTVYVQKLLLGLDGKEWASIFINYSAQTSANQSQDIIDGKLDKRRKGVFGPPMGKRCVIFVDDLNMPALETYGAQPPIEILRQYMDHEGWYDRKENVFRKLVDLSFVCAMGPPGGGRNPITPRYMRHFNVIAYTPFDDASMQRIFQTILDWWLSKEGFEMAYMKLSAPIIAATMDIYKASMANLLPTPSKSHYTFNLRDFARVVQGMLLSTAADFEKTSDLLLIWSHEVFRVFYDRLTDDDDRLWFIEEMKRSDADALQHGHGHALQGVRHQRVGRRRRRRRALPALLVVHRPEGGQEDVQARARPRGDAEGDGPVPRRLQPDLVQADEARALPLRRRARAAHRARAADAARQRAPRRRRRLRPPVGHAASRRTSPRWTSSRSRSPSRTRWPTGARTSRRSCARRAPRASRRSSSSPTRRSRTRAYLEDINGLLNAGEVPNLFPNDEKAQICDRCATRRRRSRPGARHRARRGRRGRLADDALRLLCDALPRAAPHLPRDVADRRRLPPPAAHVPLARQLLHHRLVPPVAGRRARRGRVDVPRGGGDGEAQPAVDGRDVQDLPRVGARHVEKFRAPSGARST